MQYPPATIFLPGWREFSRALLLGSAKYTPNMVPGLVWTKRKTQRVKGNGTAKKKTKKRRTWYSS